MLAGLDFVQGKCDAVVLIDSDLQHPPELIPEMIENWHGGAEVVATVRRSNKDDSLIRKVASRTYYWLMSHVSELSMVSQTTDFRLYDKKVVDAFCKATEHGRIFRGIMDWMGYRRVYLEFEADARAEGDAKYSYTKLIRLAINSITYYSLWPLRIVGYLGVLIMLASGALLGWMLISTIIFNQATYTPLAIVVIVNTLLIGIVLSAIGLIALYIGAIHTEVLNRPLYLVRDQVGVSDVDLKK